MPQNRIHATPTLYAIRISGRLGPEWAEWFGSLAFCVGHTEDGLTITTLSGSIPDQAALFGILNRVRDLGLKLISVNRIEPGLGPCSEHDLKKEEAR
jgi:hypothetical protein